MIHTKNQPETISFCMSDSYNTSLNYRYQEDYAKNKIIFE